MRIALRCVDRMAYVQFLIFFLAQHLGHNKRYQLFVCDIWDSGATTDDQFLFTIYWPVGFLQSTVSD